MIEYVLVYYTKFMSEQYILLKKEKPEYQQGRYNLPGGKVEPGETPEDAAFREFEEETGIQLDCVDKHGEIRGKDFVVHVFDGWTEQHEEIIHKTDYEQPFWDMGEFFTKRNLMMPNLLVIIPLMQYGLRDWIIYDDENSVVGKPHKFSIEVLPYD